MGEGDSVVIPTIRRWIQAPGLLFLLLWLSACAGLPSGIERIDSHLVTDTEETALGRLLQQRRDNRDGQSGFRLLAEGLDAFVVRVRLADRAETSIDVQYYRFQQDTVGRLLLLHLLNAAERGVRVRILIDDIYGHEAENIWSCLDSHENMEVRLFNPFVRGRLRSLQWLFRFNTVNYRMHCKSFTVDNQAAVVGGRNIGDEYFNADPELSFADMDLLAVGPVVTMISKAFDRYWNSDYAYPASTLAPIQHGCGDGLAQQLERVLNQPKTEEYQRALRNSALGKALGNGSLVFDWGEATLFSDPVDKNRLRDDGETPTLFSRLWPHIQQASSEVIIISPYFVPGRNIVDTLCRMSENNVRVRILTNSLASSDVPAVHAGYIRYRKQLIRSGIELFELDEVIRQGDAKRSSWLPGPSKSSLHAKAIVVDRQLMFVGSMNMDHRSLCINSEIGILFRNDQMAQRFAGMFDREMETAAFRLRLVRVDGMGELIQWHRRGEDHREMIFRNEPFTGFWKRLGVELVRALPIESLL